MMIRIFAMVLVLFATSLSAHAGDTPGYPGCKGYKCPQPEPQPEPQPMPPPMNPSPVPGIGFCSGTFEGWYLGQPGPVAFRIDQVSQWGELNVTAWWRGGMWFGKGICQQCGPFQARLELYFPNAPVHRAIMNADPRGFAVMEGQIDYGFFFRLGRTSW